MFLLTRSRPLTIPSTISTSARPVSGRWIDPRAQRLGAAGSALVLLIGLATGTPWVVPAVGLSLAVSAAFGSAWFVFSRPWPLARRILALGPSELEHELPPRFAQALGATCLGLASLLLAIGVEPWAWLPVLGVIGLQLLLAATGYCLGCRLFFLRWWVPDLFARLVGRGIRREALVIIDLPRYEG